MIINSYLKNFIERKREYAIELIRSIDHETDNVIRINTSRIIKNESVTNFSQESPNYVLYKMLSQTNSVQEIYDDIQRLRSKIIWQNNC